MSQYGKNVGYRGESLVLDDYLHRGFTLVKKNFTMRGGEIDLIVHKDQLLVFVEVKTINFVNEVHDYVTGKKLHYVNKTIEYFLTLSDAIAYKGCDIRLDMAFVQHGRLLDIFENVSL